ncbi:uncharacterized protein c19h1orf216 isoform X2 [Stigmatopora argus]
MLDPDHRLAYRGQDAANRSSPSSLNRKYDQDGNSNFLRSGGDENQNPQRPGKPGPLGPESKISPGVLSPRSRLPCWSTLEPLPEIEYGEDGSGRVPPDGAEERQTVEEDASEKKTDPEKRRSSLLARSDLDEMMKLENDDEWGDSGSESDSGGSMSSVRLERGADWLSTGGLERMTFDDRKDREPAGSHYREPPGKRRSFSRPSVSGAGHLEDLLEEGTENHQEQSSDSDAELPQMMDDAVWTLRDRERFKAQEMEKHQVQLTMYRRLALIRWLRTLQARVEEQQNRLQSSFDVILTHRKELLRVGAAVVNAVAPPAAVGQS